ncbi:MAG: DUF2911 domain-containing protein [Bryobacteraceae bacterium]
MMKLSLALMGATLLAGAMPGVAAAQAKSPHETVSATIGGGKVTISYGRPSIRGREIMGGLVPYGQVWRTGADEATKLTTEVDLNIGGLRVPKGSYGVFTLPTKEGWQLIINKTADQWGAFKYDAAKDLGRVPMKVGKPAQPVEQFTIALTADTLKMSWENTVAQVEIGPAK